MYPKSFEYSRAESVEHAIELLHEYGDEAKLLAGGASLIPLMKFRLASPTHLVDIGPLGSLAGVQRQDGAFIIGPLTRHVELERHPELRDSLPIVHDAASHIGDAQVRNMGTIGGGIAQCDPAGDWPPVLLALDSSVRVKGRGGERTIPASELFLDAYTTALQHDEVITEVHLPAPGARFGAAHLKLERRAGDFPIANCSVAVTLDQAGRCEWVRIGLGGVGLCPTRVPAAEALLAGQELSEPLLAEAIDALVSGIEAFGDVRASEEYRRHMGGVMFRRALEVARRRAQGERVEVSHVS